MGLGLRAVVWVVCCEHRDNHGDNCQKICCAVVQFVYMLTMATKRYLSMDIIIYYLC